MKKRYITLVEIITYMSLLSIIGGLSASFLNSALKTNAQLEKVRLREIQVERLADHLRKSLVEFNSKPQVTKSSVSCSDQKIEIVDNKVFFYKKNKLDMDLNLPTDSKLSFSSSKGVHNNQMIIAKITVKKNKTTKVFSIKSAMRENHEETR